LIGNSCVTHNNRITPARGVSAEFVQRVYKEKLSAVILVKSIYNLSVNLRVAAAEAMDSLRTQSVSHQGLC
jgi:hypothetical protein